eukprot:Tamp_22521.p1 GENE.Tamp_22521~~Tamp_22521.p1  ORF type:complete len:151 (-),score=19.56 Tamp_22521:81-533(-)
MWMRVQGNSMVEREAKLREANFRALTQHLTTKEGAYNAMAHSAGGHEEGSRWWSEHHWQQSISCSVTSRVRGPGGSWAVCDPHRMRKCGCVIYTLQTARDIWGGAVAVDSSPATPHQASTSTLSPRWHRRRAGQHMLSSPLSYYKRLRAC